MILEGLKDTEGYDVEITCLIGEPEVTRACYEIKIKHGYIQNIGYQYVYYHRLFNYPEFGVIKIQIQKHIEWAKKQK